MGKPRRVVFVGVVAGLIALTWLAAGQLVHSQPPAKPAAAAPAVPEGQTYTGAKRCSSCHFKQYMVWKKTKHAKEAYESLPAKYRSDPECLKCHVTGYGVASGYAAGTAPEVLSNLLGTSCEACHGPGSTHEQVAKKYANKKKLDPAEEKEVRGTIHGVLPQNVCIQCHTSSGHKEHPKYDKS